MALGHRVVTDFYGIRARLRLSTSNTKSNINNKIKGIVCES